MKLNPEREMGETWLRFAAHWIAACYGHFLRVLLPLLVDYSRGAPWQPFPRWWVMVSFAAGSTLVAAVINANLPITPRELIKSVALGLAISSTVVILKLV